MQLHVSLLHKSVILCTATRRGILVAAVAAAVAGESLVRLVAVCNCEFVAVFAGCGAEPDAVVVVAADCADSLVTVADGYCLATLSQQCGGLCCHQRSGVAYDKGSDGRRMLLVTVPMPSDRKRRPVPE